MIFPLNTKRMSFKIKNKNYDRHDSFENNNISEVEQSHSQTYITKHALIE